jgi:hypothetical protein
MILSDSQALKSYFNKGAEYCDNTAPSIIECINRILNDYSKYRIEVIALKQELLDNWMVLKNRLISIINNL